MDGFTGENGAPGWGKELGALDTIQGSEVRVEGFKVGFAGSGLGYDKQRILVRIGRIFVRDCDSSARNGERKVCASQAL